MQLLLILIADSPILSRRTFENNGNCFVSYVFCFASNRTIAKSGCDGSIYCDSIISVENVTGCVCCNVAMQRSRFLFPLNVSMHMLVWQDEMRWFCDVARRFYPIFGR